MTKSMTIILNLDKNITKIIKKFILIVKNIMMIYLQQIEKIKIKIIKVILKSFIDLNQSLKELDQILKK